MFPKNKNIAFKFESKNEFNEFVKFIRSNKNYFKIGEKINFFSDIFNHYESFKDYIFYDSNGDDGLGRFQDYVFYIDPYSRNKTINELYLIIKCNNIMNIIRNEKLKRILEK